jgi:hypothetical protein
MAKIKPAVAPPVDNLWLLELDMQEVLTFVGLMSAAMAHVQRMLNPMTASSGSKCEAVKYLLMTAEAVERGGDLVRRLPPSQAHPFYEEIETRVLANIADLLEANRHVHDDEVEDRTRVN